MAIRSSYPETRNQHVARNEVDGCCQSALGVSVPPKLGRVALFYSTMPQTHEVDLASWHGACDVLDEGAEKWVSNLWFSFGLLEATKA